MSHDLLRRSLNFRYSLRAALIAFVLLPLGLLSAGVGWYGLANLEHQVEARMQQDIELVARAIRLPLSHALERDRPGSLQQALDSAFRIDHVYGAYVYDRNGELLAASGPRNPQVTTRREAREVTESGSHGAYAERGGQQVYSYFVTLADSAGRINGLLQVTREGADIHDYLATLRGRSLILLLVVVLTLSALVVYGHHRAVGRHFSRMEAGMARIRGGERDHRMAVSGPREIRDLAGAMNAMLNAIDHSEAEIEHRRQAQSQLEAQLRRSEKMAAVGHLAAGVAHELGTPLNVVDGHAQRAARNADGKVLTALEQVRSEVRRMERIVRQLLDFGRNNPLRRSREPAERIARSVASRLAEQASAAGIEIELAGPQHAPAIEVDRTRMEQALDNLLANALHAARGRVKLTWFLGDEGTDGFTVEDDGTGIPPHARLRLFEPFFTTKRVGEGTGLGLAVAHGAVTDHGGEIHVDDSSLGGACFRIVLPRGATT